MTNNLKNELEKIKMSKDTKERIIAACENSVRNRSISKTDNDDYTDHVFTAERIKLKNRLLRSISAVAACAVIAGGIGTTGYLLNRNGSVPATETETTESVEEVKTDITPFGDFNTYDFLVSRGKGNDNQIEPLQLSSEENEKVAAYLNNFDPLCRYCRILLCMYNFQWEKDNVTYYLGVCEMGYAVYAELPNDDKVQGINEPKYRKITRIDFEAFDKGIECILNTQIKTNLILI